jgi:signal transduction histidine kinase/CheY-like chemotaxis protein
VASEAHPHSSVEPKLRERVVLLVEDNPGDADLIQELLSDARAVRRVDQLLHVSTLTEAAAVLIEARVDAVVLDLQLPDGMGTDCVHRLRILARDVPIVVLTGVDDDELALACIEAGAQDYLSKQGLQRQSLRRALDHAMTRVRELLERRRADALQDRLAGLLDMTPDATVVVTDAGVVLYANAAAHELLGASMRVGQPLAFAVHETPRQPLRLTRDDGAQRLCELRAVTLDWDGAPALLASIRDVTELQLSRLAALDGQHLAESHAQVLTRLLDAITSVATRLGLPAVARATAPLVHTPPSALSDAALAEILAPFEEAFAGFVDANARLALQNRALADAKAEVDVSNRELEAFSRSVAHDLRAPLRSIDGFTTILLEQHGAALDARARGYLERVHAAAGRMTRLIEGLLRLARITRAGLRRGDTDLAEIARAAALRHAEQAPERSVDVRIPAVLVVQADYDLMQIAVDNLIDNAFKFTSHTVDARIELGTKSVDGERVVYVRDNGAGFDPSFTSKLFGVFQRLHGVDEFEGTGVGLSIVKTIIERHGGRVWAEGHVGRGATISFVLPARGETR